MSFFLEDMIGPRRVLAVLCLVLASIACSSSGTGSGGTPTALATLCRQIGAAGCGEQTEAACHASEDVKYQHMVLAGCAAQYEALYACEGSMPFVCRTIEGGDVIALATADCKTQQTAARDCTPHCQSGAGTKIHFDCTGGPVGSVQADCTPECSCTCTAGPKTGTTFVPTSCSLFDVESLLYGHCY
jgi:hypothetical protein